MSGASVSVIDETSGSGMPPPSVIFFPSVREVSQVTPKPSVVNTETMTEPVQAAVLAPQPAALLSLVRASVSARPSSSSGLAEPSPQTSEGTAETPLLTAASNGAPGNDFIGQLIDANLKRALYEFLSPVRDQPTVDLPRLLQRIWELGYRLPDPLPQAQQSSSRETLREPDNAIKQDLDDDRRDEPNGQELQGEQQDGGSKPEYSGIDSAFGASAVIEFAMVAVGLFAGDGTSPKFVKACATNAVDIAQPVSSPVMTARNTIRGMKSGSTAHRSGNRGRIKSPSKAQSIASVSILPMGKRLERMKHTVRWRASSASSESEVPAATPKSQLIFTPMTKPKNPNRVTSAVKSKLLKFVSRPSRDDHDYSLCAGNSLREEELSKKEGERGGASTFSATCGDTKDNAKASAISATCGQLALAATTSASAVARMKVLASEVDSRSRLESERPTACGRGSADVADNAVAGAGHGRPGSRGSHAVAVQQQTNFHSSGGFDTAKSTPSCYHLGYRI